MKKLITWAAPLLVLSACGGDPVAACEDYIQTANDCAAEAAGTTAGTGATAGLLDAATFCQAYDGLSGDAKKAAFDAFDCASKAYDIDCSDSTAYATASTDAGVCIIGG